MNTVPYTPMQRRTFMLALPLAVAVFAGKAASGLAFNPLSATLPDALSGLGLGGTPQAVPALRILYSANAGGRLFPCPT